nr:hypothetical protein Iba_chr04fCG12360 [Ipomoea batatas]
MPIAYLRCGGRRRERTEAEVQNRSDWRCTLAAAAGEWRLSLTERLEDRGDKEGWWPTGRRGGGWWQMAAATQARRWSALGWSTNELRSSGLRNWSLYQLHLESLKNLPKWEASHRDWEDKRREILDEQREKMDRLWKEYGKARSNPPNSLDQRRPVVKVTEIEWRNWAEKEKVTLIGKFVNERPPLDMFRTKFQKDFSITGSGTHWINQYKACSDLILTGRGLQKDFSKRSGIDREQVGSVLGVVAEVVNGYPCSGCSSIYHHRSTTEEVALAPNGVGAIGPPKGDAKAHDGSEAKHCDGGEAEHCDGL